MHQESVTEILRFALDDKMKGSFYFDTAPFFVSKDFPLLRHFLSQPITIIPFRVLIRYIWTLAFLHGNKAATTCIVLKRRYPRLTEMTELHFLHMYSGDTPCSVTLDGDTEISLVEEGGGATDVVHGRDGELLGQRVTFHLGGVSSQDDQYLPATGKAAELLQKLADVLRFALSRRNLML